MEHETTKTEEKGDDIDVSIPTTKTATPLTQGSNTDSNTKTNTNKPTIPTIPADRKTIMFSLLLDPVKDSELDSIINGDTNSTTMNTSSQIKNLEVHTVLGNEKGLIDGGVNAKMNGPTGLCESSNGLYLYFCEYGSHAIREATLSGPVTRTIAGKTGNGFQDGPCSTSRFKHPNDICVLPTGNNTSVLIVADTGNHAVRCINLRTDKVTTLLCGKNNKSNKKQKRNDDENKNNSKSSSSDEDEDEDQDKKKEDGNDDDDDDDDDDAIDLLAPRPKALFSGKHFDNIVIQSPRGVCAAGKEHPGVFFVCDAIKILEVNLLSRTCRVLAGGGDLIANQGAGQRGYRDGSFRRALFDHPTGLAFDSLNGHLYVTDSHNHVIRLLYENQVTTVAGCGRAGYVDGYANELARFKFPQKVAINVNEQHLYVSELNDVIRGITLPQGDLKGRVWTMAGSGQPGRQDGPALTSTWQFPCGLFYSKVEQILYCADSDNHCVRTIVVHDGWVLPLDAELYVQRAMISMAVPDLSQTFSSSSSFSPDRRQKGFSSEHNNSFSPSPSRNNYNTSSSPLHASFLPHQIQTKFRRTLDSFIQKAKKELENVNFAIFRTGYMLQHPSATVLLLAEALAVIVQDTDLSHPELDQINQHDNTSKIYRMSIFQKRKKGPSLLSQLKVTSVGQLSPCQVAKLVHCVQKLDRAYMSKAPDLHRLKKWVITRCNTERFILEHNVNSTPFPPPPTPSSSNQKNNSNGNSIGNSNSTMFVSELENQTLQIKELQDQSLSSLWKSEHVGDPEVTSVRSTAEMSSTCSNNNKINLLDLGAGTGAQRYAQLSYHEVCRENELLRRELETMRKNSRLILDVMEGAIAAPGASANHLALHSILGMPSVKSDKDSYSSSNNNSSTKTSSATEDAADNSSGTSNVETGVNGKVTSMEEGSMAHHKFQRQARQAAIIIEELERTLSQPVKNSFDE